MNWCSVKNGYYVDNKLVLFVVGRQSWDIARALISCVNTYVVMLLQLFALTLLPLFNRSDCMFEESLSQGGDERRERDGKKKKLPDERHRLCTLG